MMDDWVVFAEEYYVEYADGTRERFLFAESAAFHACERVVEELDPTEVELLASISSEVDAVTDRWHRNPASRHNQVRVEGPVFQAD